MSPSPSPFHWRVLLIGVLAGGCRSRPPPEPTADWKPGAGARAEAAALLLLDKDGKSKAVCLPGRTQERQLFPGVALARILDVRWQGGPLVAGWAVASGDADPGLGGELVLLEPQGGRRRLAKGVLSARFSPDGTALAYEVAQPGNGGAGVASPMSYVLELATGKLTELGALVDPLWEVDGRHLYATRLRTASEEHGASSVSWTSLRVRWDRDSGKVTADGPGSAQIPAPVGAAVAWSEGQRGTTGRNPCAVRLLRRGGIPHAVVGRFCMGMADDRSVRWSPDGQWLAFPHPGPVPGQEQPGGFFVDVVGVDGGRYPALSALHARTRPDQLAIVTAPGLVWFDWSPSGRLLALQDGARDVRVYDFEAHGTADLGKGQRPMWSPGGAYLLIQAAGQEPTTNGIAPRQQSQDVEGSALEAFVLPGMTPAARIDLGPVLDARWLPAQACDHG
jgi:hypothetical protein